MPGRSSWSANAAGDLDQRSVVEVAAVGPVLPLVEGPAEAPGVSGDAFEVVELVEHPPGRVHAAVIVEDVVELVDPAPGRCRELLGPAESIRRDSEDVTGSLDVAASRSAMNSTRTPQFTFDTVQLPPSLVHDAFSGGDLGSERRVCSCAAGSS